MAASVPLAVCLGREAPKVLPSPPMRPTPAIGVSTISSFRLGALPRRNSPNPRGRTRGAEQLVQRSAGRIGVDGDDLLGGLRQVDGDVRGQQRAPGPAAPRGERDETHARVGHGLRRFRERLDGGFDGGIDQAASLAGSAKSSTTGSATGVAGRVRWRVRWPARRPVHRPVRSEPPRPPRSRRPSEPSPRCRRWALRPRRPRPPLASLRARRSSTTRRPGPERAATRGSGSCRRWCGRSASSAGGPASSGA